MFCVHNSDELSFQGMDESPKTQELTNQVVPETDNLTVGDCLISNLPTTKWEKLHNAEIVKIKKNEITINGLTKMCVEKGYFVILKIKIFLLLKKILLLEISFLNLSKGVNIILISQMLSLKN